jgi:5-methyltetrahydrofolate--homocysteine methyltransferase
LLFVNVEHRNRAGVNHFVSFLRSGSVLLMDGAMGTEVLRLCTTRDCCERANLADKRIVCEIHQAYLEAGADVLLTNTFQANPRALARHGLAEQLHTIWQAALDAARSGKKPHVVLAAVGPMDAPTDADARALLAECDSADGILLETWTSHEDLARVGQSRDETTPPMLVSFAFKRDGRNRLTTFAGQTPEACARVASRYGAIAVGANCGIEIGIAEMIEIVRRYHDACDLPLFVRANAGTPVGGVYPRSPEQMAEELPGLLAEGIAMVGGCCGTTPNHIRRFRMAVDAWNAQSAQP